MKINQEKLTNTQKSFNANAGRIDRSEEYHNALKKNTEVIAILKYFGLNLDLEPIPAEMKVEYQVMGSTVKSLNEVNNILDEHKEYLSNRVKAPTDPFTQSELDETMTQVSKIKTFNYMPEENIWSYSMKKVEVI